MGGGDFPIWAQILTGLAIVALLFFFGPRAYQAAKESPKGSAQDWLGLAAPVAIVVGIVAALILLARA